MRHNDGMMDSVLDIIRHAAHILPILPNTSVTPPALIMMIDMARKKLKAAFILHLFSAMFVLLALQNYVSDENYKLLQSFQFPLLDGSEICFILV